MKQKWIGFGLIIALLFLYQPDAIAQRNQTKCPPGKSSKSHKISKSLVKFPELLKTEKEQKKAEWKQERAPKERIVKDEAAKQRTNFYVKQQPVKSRMRKVTGKEIASTKCPR